VKVLDLSTELVVLDWAYEPTTEHVTELVTATAATGDAAELRRYVFLVALRVLERVGFGPLSRPTFLRLGFRDICRDFDLHEGTSIRYVLGPGRVVRAHLDYDTCDLVFRTAMSAPDSILERALSEAFPEGQLRRFDALAPGVPIEYQVRLPIPTSLEEARGGIAAMRRGLSSLMARFEPDRYASLADVLETFGARETLSGLHVQGPARAAVSIPHTALGSRFVH
jgi:hypothetical protein